MSSAAASLNDPHSVSLPLDDRTPDAAGTAAFLHAVFRQTTAQSIKMWNKLSRKTQILLVALLMTSSSFGLSMIVAALAR